MNFTVPTIPVAQPRQRHRGFVVDGHVRVQNYTPTDSPVNSFKATVRTEFARHAWELSDGPVSVAIALFFPRPKRMVWKRRPMPRQPHATKPDAENVAKAVLDALTGLAWRDDAQVYRLLTEKFYCDGAESPHVDIELNCQKQERCVLNGKGTSHG